MGIACCTADFDPLHTEGAVLDQLDLGVIEGLPEGRPPASGVELRFRENNGVSQTMQR